MNFLKNMLYEGMGMNRKVEMYFFNKPSMVAVALVTIVATSHVW